MLRVTSAQHQFSDCTALRSGDFRSYNNLCNEIVFSIHLYLHYLFIFCRFVSITLVFLNKSLLSGGTSVDAPLFITCFQCTVTAAACYAIVSLPPNVWEAKNLACGQVTISIQTLKKVLPLSVVCID